MCEIYQKLGHNTAMCCYNPKKRGKQVQNRDNVQVNQVYPLNQEQRKFQSKEIWR